MYICCQSYSQSSSRQPASCLYSFAFLAISHKCSHTVYIAMLVLHLACFWSLSCSHMCNSLNLLLNGTYCLDITVVLPYSPTDGHLVASNIPKETLRVTNIWTQVFLYLLGIFLPKRKIFLSFDKCKFNFVGNS